ncbi:alpha/beta fold hydrolase [Streptomyces sp. NPDC007088]|uniref:alpha/beta fold hydrolase n=1 Tax=Streptomyces sp. NPDC007088 TaxID=3364773 RepID=UPI00368466E3
MARRIDVTGADGVRLAAWEFARPSEESEEGRAPGVLLLHGLLGRASQWADATGWLAERHRTVALDQRGHGASEKPDGGRFTREAYITDAEAALEQLGLGPAVLVGHGMGALTAWQLAGRRPDLVRGVVVSDMRASALGVAAQREWVDWLNAWPLPFPTLEAARVWFAEQDPWVERPNAARGAFYAEIMTRAGDGWRPEFVKEQMLASREAWVHEAHWEDLSRVSCPTLVLRGLDGVLGRAEAQEMVRVLPRGTYAEVRDAGHLMHRERPDAWRAVVEPFLEGVLTG